MDLLELVIEVVYDRLKVEFISLLTKAMIFLMWSTRVLGAPIWLRVQILKIVDPFMDWRERKLSTVTWRED